MSDDWVGGSGGGSGRQNNSKKRTPVMKKIFFCPQNESFMENVKKFVYICSFKQKN